MIFSQFWIIFLFLQKTIQNYYVAKCKNWMIKIIDIFYKNRITYFRAILFLLFKKNNLHKFIHLIRTYKHPNWIWIIIRLSLLIPIVF